MFDISWGELVLVGMVALIVIGPKELPTVLRTMGQWMTKVRRMAAEFQGQFQEAMREAEFADLKKQVDSIGDPTRALSEFNPLETAQKELDKAFSDSAVTPSGESSATPSADATLASAEPSSTSSGEATTSGATSVDVTPSGEPPAHTVAEPAPTEPAPSKPTDLEGGRAA